jgi:hypothetical protein
VRGSQSGSVYKRDLGSDNLSSVFHSFRHGFKDTLRAAGLNAFPLATPKTPLAPEKLASLRLVSPMGFTGTHRETSGWHPVCALATLVSRLLYLQVFLRPQDHCGVSEHRNETEGSLISRLPRIPMSTKEYARCT